MGKIKQLIEETENLGFDMSEMTLDDMIRVREQNSDRVSLHLLDHLVDNMMAKRHEEDMVRQYQGFGMRIHDEFFEQPFFA